MWRQDRLDAKGRAAKEQQLAELKEQLAEHNRQELERKYAKRYHHVRGMLHSRRWEALCQDRLTYVRAGG